MWNIARLCTGAPVGPAVRVLNQQRIVILYVFVCWESSYNSFFPIVWYHLHPLSRDYRRTLSSVGSIAWSLGQDTGTGAQILWALLPGISPTKCCFFSKQSGSSCRPVRGQRHSLESRLPALSPLALLSILMAITAPFLSFPVSKVTTSAKGAKKQRVWTDAVSCPPPQSLVQLCQESAYSEEVGLERWLVRALATLAHRWVLSSHKAAYNLL